MKKYAALILSIILFIMSTKATFAVNNPTEVPNNKFGIHIFSEKDLENAGKLINTNGDWGYVTLVITEGERDHDRWQQVFDSMRHLHIIPIIRIASKASDGGWEIPKNEEMNNWVGFLNSLNWVIQNRYVVIGNEPNHAAEWGGTIDPAGYAKYLKTFSEKLKSTSHDFFVLPAALDASATNNTGTMDESKYLKLMIQSVPDVFSYVDGWNSHSYPNLDFGGRETATGKGSVKTFDWELGFMAGLGVTKNLPVFITETGWTNNKLTQDEIGERLTFSFEKIWNDPKVVAVTPFILDYPNPPFDIFSWKKPDGNFYSFYEKIKNLPKIKGSPVQIERGEIVGAFAQPIIPLGSNFIGAILAKNTGQSIWKSEINSIRAEGDGSSYNNYLFGDIEPTKMSLIVFKAASPENTGPYSQSLYLTGSSGQKITNTFPIEAYVTKIDWSKISQFFGNILSSISGK